MLKKRIIPCLDIKDGQTVKGVNFINIINAGDPLTLAKKYADEGADELVFLDITATVENRKTLIELVSVIAKEINIPFTVGGGINTVDHVAELIRAGADKVSINSAAVKRPELITEIAEEFGSQCVVVAIDTKFVNDQWRVFVQGGRKEVDMNTVDWAKEIEQLGGGEILLTSMNSDGTKNGFELSITDQVSRAINIPVIASGGAGSANDFKQLFEKTQANAGLAASIFHFNQVPIKELKQFLNKEAIPVRL